MAWYPATTTVPPTSGPVTLDEAKAHARVDFDDDDVVIDRAIAFATAHVENQCGIRIMPQTVAMRCDYFEDLIRVPLGPIQSISSIAYTDPAGVSQTLSADVYSLEAAGIETSVSLNHGFTWPAKRSGSRVVVTVVAGFDVLPDPIRHAILLMVGSEFEAREDRASRSRSVVDDILANYRIGA